jgi:hypothetical protein
MIKANIISSPSSSSTSMNTTPTSIISVASITTDCSLGDAPKETGDFHFDMSDRWKHAYLSSMENTLYPVKDLDDMIISTKSKKSGKWASKTLFSWIK